MKTQEQSVIEVLRAIMDAIREGTIVGSNGYCTGLPSGQLYAVLMPTGISLEQYDKIIDCAINTGLVRKTGSNELIWTGCNNGRES